MKLRRSPYTVCRSPVVFCLLILAGLFFVPILANICRADDWSPPPPSNNDGFDWIELKSGEWLKGHVKSMQNEDLEFDSEELDVRVWDWKDIRTVRSSRLMSVRFGRNKVVNGSLLVTKDEAQVVNAAGTQTIPRNELLSFIPTGSKTRGKWAADVLIGATSRQGNTEETSVNTQATVRRFTTVQNQKLEIVSNYSKLDKEVSKNDHRWTINSDFDLTRQFFIRIPYAEYFHDAEQNLDYRVTLGCGAGYELIKTPRTTWQLSLGPAFQKSKFQTVETGSSETEKSSAVLLMSTFDTELSKPLDFTLEYRGQFTGDQSGSNIHHTTSKLKFEIHKRLALNLSFVWDRVAKPKPDKNGVTPDPDDFKFITSLGIHF